MCKIIPSVIIALMACVASAQTPTARDVLDKTSDALRNAGGVEADFTIDVEAAGQPNGVLVGDIRMKGNKFVVKTTDASTWYDGNTQWSYMRHSNEVNVSNPDEEEIQSINPYALLSLYKNGYSYTMGNIKTYKNKAVYEVLLSANDTKKDILKLIVLVTRNTYYPLKIVAKFRNNTTNTIEITNFKSGLQLNDTVFVFDKRGYPQVEIIDLR